MSEPKFEKSLKPFQNVEILLWKHKGAINGFKLEVKEKKKKKCGRFVFSERTLAAIEN